MPKDADEIIESQPYDPDKASPEEAYAEAQRRIAQAKQSGAAKLELALKSLKALPPEIGNLSQLEALELIDLEVSDLGPLRGLVNLQSLQIVRLPAEDLSAIGHLTSLRGLWLQQLPATNLTPLSRLAALEMLRLELIWTTDLAPIGTLTALKTLKTEFCPNIEDITALSGLHALERLELPSTKVSAIEPLARLSALTWLDLHKTKVVDATPLANLTSLRLLDLHDTQVSDASPLSKLKALQWLRLRGTKVSDLRPLALLTDLHWLDIENTAVDELGPLVELVKLIDPTPAGKGDDDDDRGYDEDDPERDYFRPHGLHYGGTPAAGVMPYYTFAQLGVVQRTLQTINHLRELKGLPLVYPEGYYQPQRSDADGDQRITLMKERVQRAEEELSSARQELAGALRTRPEPHGFRRVVLVVTLVGGLLGMFAYLLTINEKCGDRSYLDCAKQNTIVRWLRDQTGS